MGAPLRDFYQQTRWVFTILIGCRSIQPRPQAFRFEPPLSRGRPKGVKLLKTPSWNMLPSMPSGRD